jgi:penicillin-binding protein 1A
MSSENSKKKSKSKKKQLKRKRRLVFLSTLLVFSCTALVIILIFYFKFGKDITQYQLEAKKLVAESNIETFRQSETSLVYDTNDELISVLRGEKDVYYIPYDNIPDLFKKAMIAIEDKKFLTHSGVDLKANIRAIVALIKNRGDITQGASTITQQLARNIFLTNEVSYERKLKEIFIAVELENKYSKKLIMEFYLNNIYFANGHYGIGAASNGYFDKKVSELSLSEIAFLCAIPNNPTIYNPLVDKKNTISRRNRILDQMYEDGFIGLEDYNVALNEEIELNVRKVDKHNYVETFVFYSATRALMEKEGFIFRNEFSSEEDKKNYESSYNELYNRIQKSIFHEGYRIYTSIDLDKQSKLQETVDESLKNFDEVNDDKIYALQGAAVSIDNSNGKVVAIVGGRSQDTSGYTLNRGYQSFRQPGSAIKPLIIYTPIFERGYYPDNIVVDKKFEGGPTNSNNVYSGEITINKAVEVSKNTIAWKLFEELTPKVGLSYLLNMNFSKIVSNDYYPAASLGGFTIGVSPLEITAAFSTIENDGIYREPTCIIEITDAEGNVIIGDNIKEKRIYDSNAARMMTNVLTGVMKNGTGRNLALKNMPSAGKTGTTNDKKDGWFVGYTPYYTTGVWVGYDTPRSMSDLSGATYPGTIWKNYMNEIHEGLVKETFPPFNDSRPKPTVTPTPTPTPEVTPTPSITITPSPTPPLTEPPTTTISPTPTLPQVEKPTVAPTEKPPVDDGVLEDPYMDWEDNEFNDNFE